MITSAQNPKIQQVRALQGRGRARRAAQSFVIEGVRLVEEAFEAGWEAELVLHSDELNQRGQALLQGFQERGASIEAVSPNVMKAASDTQTPQGILAVVRMRSLPMPERPDFVFILDGVRDPGNLGTMLRTATAAGVEAVLLPVGSVDPFSPKVLRAGMGAHFRVPIQNLDWEQIAGLVHSRHLHVYLAAARQGLPHTQADFRRPLALMIGGEAEGAGSSGRSLADECVHIAMPGKVESLNAAAAAATLLFEVVRQRQESLSQASGPE
jgi:TrmH family RNA methyltransferase